MFPLNITPNEFLLKKITLIKVPSISLLLLFLLWPHISDSSFDFLLIFISFDGSDIISCIIEKVFGFNKDRILKKILKYYILDYKIF